MELDLILRRVVSTVGTLIYSNITAPPYCYDRSVKMQTVVPQVLARKYPAIDGAIQEIEWFNFLFNYFSVPSKQLNNGHFVIKR